MPTLNKLSFYHLLNDHPDNYRIYEISKHEIREYKMDK